MIGDTARQLAENMRRMAQGVAQLQAHRTELDARLAAAPARPAGPDAFASSAGGTGAAPAVSSSGAFSAPSPASSAPVSPPAPAPAPAAASAEVDQVRFAIPCLTDRAALLNQLVALIARHMGWRRDAIMEGKLVRLVRDMGPDELREWVLDLHLSGPAGACLNELAKALTVNETYFHRDRDQLEVLRAEVLPAILARKAAAGDYRLSVWSAGCSTGEEAYTLAMIVLEVLDRCRGDAGTEPSRPESSRPESSRPESSRWTIDILGTDIRPDVLDRARVAEYDDFGLSPFRCLPESQGRFFVPAGPTARGVRRLRVATEVSRLTRFLSHNLLDRPPAGVFDLISCRNVMIYFDEEAKRRTQRNLHMALAEGGMLLLGPTDTVVEPRLFRLVTHRTSPVLRKEGGK